NMIDVGPDVSLCSYCDDNFVGRICEGSDVIVQSSKWSTWRPDIYEICRHFFLHIIVNNPRSISLLHKRYIRLKIRNKQVCVPVPHIYKARADSSSVPPTVPVGPAWGPRPLSIALNYAKQSVGNKQTTTSNISIIYALCPRPTAATHMGVMQIRS
ncbi:hypothetical protein SFRURICE_017300, partial [Spodoptera frugiperda]